MPEKMFHFIVTADRQAWAGGVEVYPKSRFLEYSPDHIVKEFEQLTPKKIDLLKSMPCLCAYEGEEDIQIGKIERIDLERSNMRVEVSFNPSVPPISFERFNAHRKRFGVHEWEFSRTHWAVKSGDLFEKLRESNLLPLAAVLPDVLPGFSIGDEDQQSSVGSVTQYIDKVKELISPSQQCFYRGHTDRTYKLEPSIFRTNKNGVPLYKDREHEMFRELLVSNSFDFTGDSSTLDRLVRMQHYGLPTRLLDITANPLIALFFAVFSKDQSPTKLAKDGEVILFTLQRDKIKYFDSDTASCIANLALLNVADRRYIDRSLNQYKTLQTPSERALFDTTFNGSTEVERLLHFIKAEKPYFTPRIKPADLHSVVCVRGKHSNDRITSQSGAFLLFGDEASFNEEGSTDIRVHRITVKNKAEILQDLKLLNITESTVFPNIESSANDIKNKHMTRETEAGNLPIK